MAEWSEEDSSTYREIAAVAVPRQEEMLATLVSAAPFTADDAIRIIEIGAGDGRLADRIQVRRFELDTLEWWDLMQASDLVVSSLCLHHLNDAKKQYLYKAIAERLTARGALLIADLVEPTHAACRRVAADSWDASARAQADAVRAPEQFATFVESRWNHYRFPAPGDRPSALFHHLVWLKHAGFAVVDCCWLYAGHAVYGGFKASGGPEAGSGIAFEHALTTVQARSSWRMPVDF